MLYDWRSSIAPTFALFASASTLVCCALPALLISLGLGGVMVGLTSAVPGIIWLSAHKVPVFIAASAMLLLASALAWSQRSAPCPADPAQARACRRLRRFNGITLVASWLGLACGAFFAFVWPLLFLG